METNFYVNLEGQSFRDRCLGREEVASKYCILKGLHLIFWGEGHVSTRTGRVETKRKTQERMERRSGKRSSSVGSEKMKRVGDR
jgi:hypothetical protein